MKRRSLETLMAGGLLIAVLTLALLLAGGCQSAEPPEAPNPISPNMIAKAGVEYILFAWEPLANANYYALHIARDRMFSRTLFIDSNITGPVYNVSSSVFPADSVYFWRVAAANAYGWSNWSNVARFHWTAQH